MSFSVNQDLNGSAEIAVSAAYPRLRMLTVADDCQTEPVADVRAVKQRAPDGSSWTRSEPASFGTAPFGYPSAICYFYGRSLYSHWKGAVPVGVVSAAVGGSAIEFWMRDAARADTSCGGAQAAVESACPPAAMRRDDDADAEAPAARAAARVAATAAEASVAAVDAAEMEAAGSGAAAAATVPAELRVVAAAAPEAVPSTRRNASRLSATHPHGWTPPSLVPHGWTPGPPLPRRCLAAAHRP
jgi:hypothetical protein